MYTSTKGLLRKSRYQFKVIQAYNAINGRNLSKFIDASHHYVVAEKNFKGCLSIRFFSTPN